MSGPISEFRRGTWLTAHHYGVPAEMVERATRLRLAGDWRGALAAAGFELRFSLQDVRRDFGAEVAATVEDDLANLVPDLVRWYLPRDSIAAVLRAGHGALLAEYGDTIGLTAVASTPRDGPQGVLLWCGRGSYRSDDRNRGWTQSRYMWDARATHLLLQRAGGGDRTPFFERDGRRHTTDEAATDPVSLTERVLALQDAGKAVQAWQAAGVQVDNWFRDPYPRKRDGSRRPLPRAAAAPMLPALVPIVHARLDELGPDAKLELRPGGEGKVVLSRVDGVLHARLESDMYTRGAAIPMALWRRIPDLELLRAGLISADELHPLVRAALFPDQSDPGYRPRGGPGPAGSTVEECARVEVAVQCREQQHRLAFRGGRLVALDHPPEQAPREQAIAALGGETPACFTVLDAWRGVPPEGQYQVPPRLPAPLEVLRRHGVAVLRHGDTAELLRLLDAGIDPTGFLDGHYRGALHYLATVDGEAVLGRLLAAGLDINAPDKEGSPPLARALCGHPTPSLIRAILDAGADPLVVITPDGEPRVKELPHWAVTPMVIEAARAAASA